MKLSADITDINGVFDGASSLKIANNVKPATVKNNKLDEIFPHLSKAHAYNPYKIMGFQNKETNEFAMNVLKTQAAMDPSTLAIQSSQNMPQPQPNISMLPLPQEKYDSTSHSSIYHRCGDVPPSRTMAAQIPNFIVANTNASINLTPAPQTTYAWNFRIGDRCLAKYWEDEHVRQ